MRIFRTSLIICLLFQTTILFSQEDVLRPKRTTTINEEIPDYHIGFGVEGGFNYNMFSSTLAWEWEVPQSLFNLFKSAAGISPYIGVAIDFPIDNQIGFQAKVTYDIRNYSNSYSTLLDCTDRIDGTTDNAPVDADFDVSGADLSISALLRYNITNEIVLTFGPMVSLPAGDYEQKNLLTSKSDNCFFYDEYDNPHSQSEAKFKVDDVKTRFGIDLGFGYNIPLSDGILLIPQIRLNYYFSKFTDDLFDEDDTREYFYGTPEISITNKTLNALKFGLALWF